MGQMALIILGLFVLVWIISAVVKASQDSGPKARPGAGGNRQRQQENPQRIERTSETDIDRFMAEIDRLRRKGEGAATGRPPEPPRQQSRQGESRPSNRGEARPRPGGVEHRERERERERRPKQQAPRPAPPPPLPAESIPVLRPVKPDMPSAPPPPPPPPAKLARPARLATQVIAAPPSAVLQTLQSVLKTRDGRAAALILAEIFGDPRGRTGTVRQPHRFTNR